MTARIPLHLSLLCLLIIAASPSPALTRVDPSATGVLTTSGLLSATGVLTATGVPTGTYLPLVTAGSGPNAAQVTRAGAPAPGQAITLLVWNGLSGQERITTTGPDGRYAFASLPEDANAEWTQVTWIRPAGQPGLLSEWRCDPQPGPPAAHAPCGFDLSDAAPAAPADGSTLSLPVTFRWQPRPLPGDRYALVFVPCGGGQSVSAGQTTAGQITLTALPPGLARGCYHWYVQVRSTGGQGKSTLAGPVVFP